MNTGMKHSEEQQRILFEFLRIAVDREQALSRSLSTDEWQWLFDICFMHGLVGLGFKAIERMPKEQRPTMQQWLQWTGQAEIVRQTNETVNQQSAKVQRILKKHGLDNFIIKGQGLACLYPAPDYRKSGDIDVWVMPRGYENRRLSKRRRRVIQILKPYTAKGKEIVYHHMDFTSIENTHVEIHFTPTWMFSPLHNRRVQRWFDNQFKLQGMEAQGFTMPSLETHLVIVMMHMFRHLFAEGINLKQLTDSYYILKEYHYRQLDLSNDRKLEISKNNNLDNQNLENLLAAFGLRRFVGAVEYVLQQMYGMPDAWCIVPVEASAGRVLLHDVLNTGMVEGIHDNTLKRFVVYQLHSFRYWLIYPQEMFWSFPFKIIHWCWRQKINR